MKKYVMFLLTSILLLLLPGCGQQPDTPSEEGGEAARWEENGFAAPGKLEEEQTLWAEQYQLWEYNSQTFAAGTERFGQLDQGVCGELVWRFGIVQGAESNIQTEYAMEIYDTVSGETTIKRFSQKDLGMEGKWCRLAAMDMPDREHYVFRWADYEQDEEGMYRQTADGMIYTDLEGSLQSINLRELYLEKGIHRDESTQQPSMQWLNWCCDGNGNISVIGYKENGSYYLCLLDPSGEILLEYEGTAGQRLAEPLRTREGELIFPVYDSAQESYDFLWADTIGHEWRSLIRMETSYPDIRQMYGMLGDEIYYRSQDAAADGIVKWDVKSGRRVRIFDFQKVGIGTGYDITLALREGQTPVLCLSKSKEGEHKVWLAALTEQKPAYNDTVRVADLAPNGETQTQVSACAVLASMENPGFQYEYEDASAQESRDRIMVELSQGKGPDLLFVSLEDMYLLEEKGLLLDMEELIPQELQEELLPGALEIGTVDGKLLGIPVAVQAYTLAVAGDTWTEDTWRLEDVIDLMEEGKLVGALRNPPHMMMGKYMDPLLTVNMLLRYSLGNSFLIDWENRICHFDDERFIRLLELTGTDRSKTPTDADIWLNGGKDILWEYFGTESDFLDFFVHMEEESGRIVGYPTEDDSGSYLTASGGVLVVNANIVQKEAAAGFLELLLGEELQAKKYAGCMSVRKLSPEDYIVEEESGRLVYLGGINALEVPVFADGTTALHRAKAFLENCVAAPPEYSQITAIMSEELSAMYAENKSPESAAKIINSRIQIYLDEGN